MAMTMNDVQLYLPQNGTIDNFANLDKERGIYIVISKVIASVIAHILGFVEQTFICFELTVNDQMLAISVVAVVEAGHIVGSLLSPRI